VLHLGSEEMRNASVLMVAMVLSGCGSETTVDTDVVTFNRDIAPIVFDNCAVCHRPGDAAPFSLLSYDDVSKRAEQIVTVTQSRFMPPWLPEAGFGEFLDQRHLTDAQIQIFAKWFDVGTPEGKPDDLPPQPTFAEGWQLGTPDLIVEMPEEYTLSATGDDVYRHFVLPVSIKGERYVRAMEFNPGNLRIAHHAIIKIDRTRWSQRLDQKDEVPGFDGMLDADSIQPPDGVFCSWAPGRTPWPGTGDIAWKLDGNTSVVVQLHMQTTGKPEKIRSQVGLFFADHPPTKFPFIISLHSYDIDIPAGVSDHHVTNRYVLPIDVKLQAISPHAHFLAREMHAYAEMPDGSRQWLLKINHWDFSRQENYRYVRPVSLPKGTVVVFDYVYDNSEANPLNPNHPPQRVRYGVQSDDEMAELWLQVLPDSRESRDALSADFQEYKRKDAFRAVLNRVNRDPNDIESRTSLGVLLAVQGRFSGAEKHFRFVIERAPRKIDARFAYATMLIVRRRFSDSRSQLKAILKIDPDYFKAHGSLGLIALQQRMPEVAEEHFRRCQKINPDDTISRKNLPISLFLQDKLDEAEELFRATLKSSPDNAKARDGLKAIRARRREQMK
jgi:tetratricopeptide (TPR) repeat protein